MSKRQQLSGQINLLASKAIDALTDYRKSLKYGDKNKALIDIGDTLMGTAKLMSRTNADIRALSDGVSESGISWLIRVVGHLISDLVNKATPDQMKWGAENLRHLADILEGISMEESERAEAHETKH